MYPIQEGGGGGGRNAKIGRVGGVVNIELKEKLGHFLSDKKQKYYIAGQVLMLLVSVFIVNL